MCKSATSPDSAQCDYDTIDSVLYNTVRIYYFCKYFGENEIIFISKTDYFSLFFNDKDMLSLRGGKIQTILVTQP